MPATATRKRIILSRRRFSSNFTAIAIAASPTRPRPCRSWREEQRGRGFQWFTTPEERETLWKMRHEAYFANLAMRKGGKMFTTDICVPISRLADCIVESKKDVASASFPAPIVGHVGDGNFHMSFMLDPENPAELAEAKVVEEKIIRRALEMGGTCTGEHGIGTGRKKYLLEEHGAALDAMRAIKQALDPDNRMNPGKMVDPQAPGLKRSSRCHRD